MGRRKRQRDISEDDDEVPGSRTVVAGPSENMEKLVRIVVGTFITEEDVPIVDMLMRQENSEMLVDDLCKVLKFDMKKINVRMHTLVAERIVHMRRSDDRHSKNGGKLQYLRINYKSFKNLVNYKLRQIRKLVNSTEQGFAPKEYMGFYCTTCQKKYHEFEAIDIFNHVLKRFMCPYCHRDVEEEEMLVSPPVTEAKFNEQFAQIYELLKMVEEEKPVVQEALMVDCIFVTDGGVSSGTRRSTINGKASNKIRVVIVDKEKTEEPDPQPRKELPEWLRVPTIPLTPKGGESAWMNQSSWN